VRLKPLPPLYFNMKLYRETITDLLLEEGVKKSEYLMIKRLPVEKGGEVYIPGLVEIVVDTLEELQDLLKRFFINK
jgi:hypothetical protein